MKKNDKDLENKILENIDKDRKHTESFIENINNFLEKNIGSDRNDDDNDGDNNSNNKKTYISGEDYSKIIMSAAKLIETSAKANEQIVKVLEISKRHKPKKKIESKLTKEEINQLLNSDKEEQTNNKQIVEI